jgi:hypothetical protein
VAAPARQYDLTQDEARALVMLEQRPLTTAELAPRLWAASAGTAEEETARLRLAGAVVLRLARLGLASSAANIWQVTVPGRQVARRLELLPHVRPLDARPAANPEGSGRPLPD